MSAWGEALLREADLYRDRFQRFDTLYVGGGTPSGLPREGFRRILSGLRDRFSFAEDGEVTVEVNPEDVTRDSALFWRDEGISRVSVGVQALDDACLKTLGRRHTSRRALEALEILRRAGFANLSVDLMWGLPDQSVSRWVETLEATLAYSPEHCSCYELTLEEGTPLTAMVKAGRLQLPDEEKACEFFERTSDFLQSRGYIHYEISNFARSEALVCRHNMKYWHHGPYLGLGPAAHSFDGRRRWANVSSVREYGQSLSDGRAPLDFLEELTPGQLRLETLLLGFRMHLGVPLAVVGEEETPNGALSRAVAEGLLELRDGYAVPTRKGWLMADSLPLLFSP